MGSNAGDRKAKLSEAIEAIGALPCTTVEAVSSIVETEPVGCFDGRCACQDDYPDGRCATPVTGFAGLGAGVMPGKTDDLRGFAAGRKFLNCCVRIRTAIPPHRLLEAVKEIERKLGRTNGEIRKNEKGERVYSDRPIDIDILTYGRRHINRPDLQIPHPRMLERDFVMRPLREIATNLPEMSQNGANK